MKKIKDLKFNYHDEDRDLSVFRYHEPKFEKNTDKNDEIFVKWVLRNVKMMSGKKLNEDEKYNACSLYLNNKNNLSLNEKLHPMLWLNISPTTCDELRDNEIAIDISDAISKNFLN